MTLFRAWILLGCVALIAGCGGGNGVTKLTTPTATNAGDLAQICAPENPFVADATAATTQGSLADEKKWVKAYMTEKYLWYKDIPTVNPDLYTTYSNGLLNVGRSLYDYFNSLLTPKKTSSGSKVDKFSFITTTAAWNGFVGSTELGYGYMLKSGTVSGMQTLTVSYVYPNTPAKTAGLVRGDQIVSVDGLSVDAYFDDRNANYEAVYEALYPTQVGSHTFVVKRGTDQLSISISVGQVDLQQVEHKVLTAGSKKVGYLLFNSHVPSAESLLTQAGADFKQQGVTELVVDLRYNGGGYVYLANALAFAVAGQQKTQGKVFEYFMFSDKRRAENEASYFSITDSKNQALPQLNLSKIYVLVTGDTCSASESFVNGLRGIDVEVELIGSTTCGKPYGFFGQDNCGITYAAMEFEGVNDKGVGGYSDGMAPQCAAADDLNHALGDPAEEMLAVAMKRIQGQTCSQATAFGLKAMMPTAFGKDGILVKPQWQSNKFLKRTP